MRKPRYVAQNIIMKESFAQCKAEIDGEFTELHRFSEQKKKSI
jgi:hypothetical protein